MTRDASHKTTRVVSRETASGDTQAGLRVTGETQHQPTYRYPDTHAERVQWLASGTPAPWAIYTSEAPDAYRDGLLAGWKRHQRKGQRDAD